MMIIGLQCDNLESNLLQNPNKNNKRKYIEKIYNDFIQRIYDRYNHNYRHMNYWIIFSIDNFDSYNFTTCATRYLG